MFSDQLAPKQFTFASFSNWIELWMVWSRKVSIHLIVQTNNISNQLNMIEINLFYSRVIAAFSSIFYDRLCSPRPKVISIKNFCVECKGRQPQTFKKLLIKLPAVKISKLFSKSDCLLPRNDGTDSVYFVLLFFSLLLCFRSSTPCPTAIGAES